MAGKVKKIGAVIALDGEKEFKSAVTGVNKELSALRAESALVKERFDGQANSLEALRAKSEVLTKTFEKQKQKQNEIQKGLTHAINVQKKVADGLEDLQKQYRDATDRMEEMKKSSNTSEKELEQQEKAVKELADAIKRGTENYARAGERVSDWETKLKTAETQCIRAERAVKQNADYMNEAAEATDKCAKSIDGYGKKVKEAAESTEDWKDAVKEAAEGAVATGAAVAAGALAMKESVGAALEIKQAQNQLQASTGATAAAMKDYNTVMNDIYKNNFGENFEDIAQSVAMVRQNLGDLDSTTLQNVTEDAITLRDTFDMDMNETLRGASAMMKNMGVSADTAFNLIASGAQNGLNKTDELGDNLAEYSQLWGQAGFSAEQMFSILQNGLDSGAYNLDKVNDFVKEFTISLADGRVEESISSFSEGTQQLFGQWQTGGATAAEVFQSVIADLGEMENQQEALTLASNTWSALGEDNAMSVITSLNDVNDTYKDVQGTMEDIQKIKYDDMANQITQISRDFQMKIAEPIAEDWLPRISKALNVVGDNLDEVTAGAIGLGSAIMTYKAIKSDIFQGFIRGLKATTAATESAEAAQKGLNAAQKANIYALAASLLVGLGTAAFSYYKKCEEAKDSTKELREELESNRQTIEDSISSYEDNSRSMEATWLANDKLVQKLYELDAVESKSTAQRQEMKSIVNQLSGDIPELAEAYNEENSAMTVGYEQMQKNITKRKEYAMAIASQNAMVDIAKEAAQAEIDLQTINDKLEELETKRNEIRDSYGNDNIYAINAGIRDTSGIEKEIDKLEEEKAAYEETYNTANEKMTMAEETAGKYADALEEVENENNALQESTNSTAEAISGLTEEQVAAAQELADSVKSSLDSTTSAFEEFSAGTEISSQEVINNLKSQIDGVSNWKDNMKILAEQSGQGMSEGFYEYLAEMGPESANLVQELVDSLRNQDGKFEEICKLYTEKMDLDGATQEVIAEGQQALMSGMDTLAQEAAQGTENINQSIKEVGNVDLYTNVRTAFKNAAVAAGQGGDEIYANASVAFYRAVQAAQDAGVQIPQKIADGIASAEISPAQAIEQINKLVSQTQEDGTAKSQTAGSEMAAAQAQGINSKAGEVESAAGTAVSNANLAAGAFRPAFYNTGANLADGMAVGINSKAGEVANSAASLVSNAIAAARAEGDIHSPSRKFRDMVGKQIGEGVGEGVKIGGKSAVTEAVQMCRNALDASKKELEINSPSKKFKNEVGLQVASGFAGGITEGGKQVLADFSKMGDGLFTQAEAWLKEYKKKNSVSLADEKYFWKQVKKEAEEGSESYIQAVEKLEKLNKTSAFTYNSKQNISNMFGVSRKDDTGAKKSDADYYSEVYNAANKYLSNYKVLHNVSLEEEQKYWQNVRNKLKKGTQGYIDAQAQINSIKESIAEQKEQEKQEKIDNAISGSQLEAYKTYYKVSAKAEVDYWNTVRKKFKEGTAERLAADQQYFEAKESYNSQLEELNQEYLENTQDVNDQLISDVQDLTDAYNDALKERTDTIYNSFGLFDEFASESAKGVTLLYNLRTQVAGFADWEQQLKTLNEKGILSDGLMDELKEMGPEASASIHALNELTDAQLQEYESLYQQKKALAASQAEQDEADLKAETASRIEQLKSEAQAQLNAYKEEYEAASAELSAAIEEPLKNLAKNATTLGEDATLSLIKGIKNSATKNSTSAELKTVTTTITSGLSSLTADGKALGKDTLQGILDELTNKKKITASAKSMVNALKKAVKEAAEIKSPSRLFKREVGEQITAGVAEGMDENEKEVSQAGSNMITTMFSAAKEKMKKQQALLQEYASGMTGSAGLDMLDNVVNETNINTVNVDNTGIVALLTQAIGVMQEYLPQIGNTELVLDGGALVSGTIGQTSTELARLSRRTR